MLSIAEIREQYPDTKDLSDSEILFRVSKLTELPIEQVAQDFGIKDPRNAPKGTLGGVNDFMINTANAAVGGLKAGIDFVSPGSDVSKSLQGFIESGEQKLSLQERLSQQRLGEGLQSSDIGTQAGAVYDRFKEAPFQVGAQALGSFAIPGAAIKGARGVVGALGAGEKALSRVGTGTAMGTGALLAGGDAAGEAYDRVFEKTGDRELATQAAREASIAPAFVGAATSLIGADKALARGGSRSILKTTGGEFAGEFIDEATTKASANIATSQYVPGTDIYAGVFGSGLMGGIQGAGTGAAVGMMSRQRTMLAGSNETGGLGGLQSDGSGIGKAINIDDASVNTKTAIPPRGPITVTAGGEALVTPEQQQAYDQFGRNQVGPFPSSASQQQQQSGQVAAANVQAQAQQQQQQAALVKEQEAAAVQQQFSELASVYGLSGGQPGTPFLLGSKNLFKQEDADIFLREVDKLNEGRTLEQKQAFGSVLASGAVKIKPDATAKALVNSVNLFMSKWGLRSSENTTDLAERVNANIGRVEGSNAVNLAGPLNDLYRTITGQDSPAFGALVAAAEAPTAKVGKKGKAAPAAQQPSAVTSIPVDQYVAPQGAGNDGQLPMQDNAGLRDVRVQGGATGPSQEGLGLLQPQSVQPIQSGSVVGGQNRVQDDVGGDAGARAGTTELTTGRDANVGVDELTEAETKVRELLVASFGERDTNIIYDVLMNDLSGPQIAKKYGISQQRVDQIAGPKAQKSWGPRIEKGAARLGMTIDQVEAIFTPFEAQKTAADTENLVDDQADIVEGRSAPEAVTRTLSDEADKNAAEFADGLGREDLFDNDETGAKAGFGIIGSVGGSQSETETGNDLSKQWMEAVEKGDTEEAARIQGLMDGGKGSVEQRLEEAKARRKAKQAEGTKKPEAKKEEVKAKPEAKKEEAKKEEAKKEEVVAKTPSEQWAETVAPFNGAAWADLTKDQQERWSDLVSRGTANLAAATKIADDVTRNVRTTKKVDQKQTKEQKEFFDSLEYTEEVTSGENKFEAAEVAPQQIFDLFPGIQAIDNLMAKLGLSQVVSGIQKILVYKGPAQNAAMVVHRQMSDGSIQSMLAFNESTLSDPDQDSLAYTFTHETGHLVDYAGFGGVYSSHPDMDFVVKNGKYISTGGVSRAFVNWINNPKTDPELAELLTYPLQYTPEQMGMQEMKEELFAQGWALFLNPQYNSMMAQQAPAVYAFYKEVYNHVAKTTSFQYKSQSGAEVRAAVRAADFTGSENRPPTQGSERVQRKSGDSGQVRPAKTVNITRSSIEATRTRAEKEIAKLPKPYQGPLNAIMDTLTNAARKGLVNIAFTKDLAVMAAQKGLTAAIDYVGLMGSRQFVKTENERRVESIVQSFDKLPSNLKGTGAGSVNAFLKESTMGGAWGFQPSWLSKPVKVDGAMQAKFDALPKDAQAVIKSVFKHGYDTLMEMKKSVMANINTEYDALIADAQMDGNVKEVADLQKQKSDSLKNYQSLMAVNANSPYAPLKRFGNYVVVGRSAEYIDAEETATSNTASPEERKEARKELAKMQTDEKHYFVQFAETNAEAKAIARENQRLYPGGVVQNFEKEQVRDSLYGGRDIQGVFYRLRNLINESQEDKNIADASKRSLNRLVNDLHLSLLSEHSARQSERRRKGVAGADDDMMRAFVTQGRATAHFLSTLHNSGAIYDSLQAMRKQAGGLEEGRDVRSQYYNEMLKRHAMSLEYQVSPYVDKMMSATSTWMLLTNPAYYLQNLTQPMMMSLPVIAAKHGYTKSASAMIAAYKELTSVLTKNGLNEDTYSKLPADVRSAIESLVNSGHIDISLSQDLGRWRSSGDQNVAAKALDKIRSISEDVESINRVVTAVAAYRLDKASGATEKQATTYAGKVVYDTHGDYSGFNAPRFSRQGIGRMATQFRKFQLIQISLLAKLGNQAFKGATAEERAIGKRALAYTLTHTFAVSGVMGLPGFTAIAWILGSIFGDSDEPDIPEATIRKVIGDDTLADLLTKGIPNLFGMDLSGKLGMGQALSIMPYTNVDMSRDGYARAVTAAMGPFVGGIMPKVVDGIAQISDGNYYKGIENITPSGISQAMKGYRMGTEGVTKRNGEVILSPDDITFLDAFMQGIGLPTRALTDRQFVNRTQIQYEQFYSDRSSDIKSDYIKAYKKGDSESMEQARIKWMEMQDSRQANGFKRQPLSDLFRAPINAAKREVKTVRTLDTSGTTAAGFQVR